MTESKFSDPPPLLILGVLPFWGPTVGQGAYVGHLSTDVHNVGVFYGFSRVLSWFIIDSNQPEVYLTNFRSAGVKRGIPFVIFFRFLVSELVYYTYMYFTANTSFNFIYPVASSDK